MCRALTGVASGNRAQRGLHPEQVALQAQERRRSAATCVALRLRVVRLRLYHHPDGARVAYRELGAGPPLALLHSAMLSHKEFEPAVEQLADRFRVVLPDLPLHGDSEDRPRHPYTLDWFAEVISRLRRRRARAPSADRRPRRRRGDPAARDLAVGACAPRGCVLMPNRLHAAARRTRALRTAWRLAATAGAVPGLDRLLTHGARAAFTPERGLRLTARADPAARDLLRHAFADVPGNPYARALLGALRARAGRAARRRSCSSSTRACTMPVLLLWADRDRLHPLATAEEALRAAARRPAARASRARAS